MFINYLLINQTSFRHNYLSHSYSIGFNYFRHHFIGYPFSFTPNFLNFHHYFLIDLSFIFLFSSHFFYHSMKDYHHPFTTIILFIIFRLSYLNHCQSQPHPYYYLFHHHSILQLNLFYKYRYSSLNYFILYLYCSFYPSFSTPL